MSTGLGSSSDKLVELFVDCRLLLPALLPYVRALKEEDEEEV